MSIAKQKFASCTVAVGTLLFVALCLVFASAPASAFSQRSDSIIAHFEQVKGVTITNNNHLVLLPSGKEKFTDLFQAVRNARHTIHMEYFNFRHDSIADALFELLEQKVREGVNVRVLYDAFGNASNNSPIKKDELKDLRNSGIEIYEYYPLRFPWLDYALHRDHRKIVVIDGKIAYTGGMNVADYYINGTEEVGDWRDLHMRLEGGAVHELQRIFLRIWNKTAKQNLKESDDLFPPAPQEGDSLLMGLKRDSCDSEGHKQIAVINREPNASPKIIRRTFVAAINSAQENIEIINPYFTLNHKIRKALKNAIKRGVEVEIMMSENCDIPITPRVGDYNARKLQKKGAKVYYYQGGFHHSKIMTVDGLYSFLGSANLNSRSLRYDYECNLLVLDQCTTAELRQLFAVDRQNHCVPLTDEYWHKRSHWKNFQGWLFSILSPFL